MSFLWNIYWVIFAVFLIVLGFCFLFLEVFGAFLWAVIKFFLLVFGVALGASVLATLALIVTVLLLTMFVNRLRRQS